MTILDAVLSFSLVAGLLTLVPGLDTALVLRSTLTRRPAYAWATALGVATGAMVWGLAAALGISALLAASELAYRALVVVGAAYMMWLGGSMLWRSWRRRSSTMDADAPGAAPARQTPADSAWRGWLIGAGTNLLNPKVGVFYIATLPLFMPPDVAPMLMGALLAGIHAVLTMAWFAVLILGGGLARRWLADPRAIAWVDRVTGTVLVLFGGRLLVDAWAAPGPPATSVAVR